MIKKLLFVILFVFMSSVAGANPILRIAATNGFVLTYLDTSTYYMLSTARIFNRPNGTGINCYGAGTVINIVAVPSEGYVFNYWTGTIPLSGNVSLFTLPEGGAELVAYFKKVDAPVEPPDCPTPEACPEVIIPPCPEVVIPPCPEVIIPPCPECIIPPCAEPEPCPEVVIPPCPAIPKGKDDEGACFINTIKNY